MYVKLDELKESYKFLYQSLPEDIKTLESRGHIKGAKVRIEELLENNISKQLRKRLIYELERLERLRKDFKISEEEAFSVIKKEFQYVTREKLEEWMEKGWLEYILIEGEKFFYNRFLDNLLFMCTDEICEEKNKERKSSEEYQRRTNSLRTHVKNILHSAEEGYISPLKVRAGITVKPREGVIEDGTLVKCWLPFPKHGEQTRMVRVLRTFPQKYVLAPSDVDQRTVYFEFTYDKEINNHCTVEFEYEITGYKKRVDPDKVVEYDKNYEIYMKYTEEKPPHIVFTRSLKSLTDEITDGEENPYLKAKKIYEWITKNVRYTYVREYSTYETIPKYVVENLRGDCGFQALTFITMARIAGIPSKWQSGWYTNPNLETPSPHDWAQFYIEPYGWLYADLSFGGRWRKIDREIHEFYFGNIDSFRTVFNSDIQGEFQPQKKYLRSDPVDNQRGEIETEDRNLYYDEFDTQIYFLKEAI